MALAFRSRGEAGSGMRGQRGATVRGVQSTPSCRPCRLLAHQSLDCTIVSHLMEVGEGGQGGSRDERPRERKEKGTGGGRCVCVCVCVCV